MSNNFIIQQDGDKWFATTDNFKNLQESDVVFNDDPESALHSLIVERQTRVLVDDGHIGTPKIMIDKKYFGPHKTYDVAYEEQL